MGVFHPATSQYRWILINSQAILDPSTGQLQAALTTFLDITARKRAEEEIRRLNAFQRRVFESIKDELMVVDVHDFSVLAANKALLESVGMREEDVVSKPCYTVTHGRSAKCSKG
jgi:PAS domain-containing protein